MEKSIEFSSYKSSLKRRSIFYFAATGMLFILAVSSIFPIIRSMPFFNQMWAICLLGWFAFTILDNPKFIYNDNIHRIAIYFYILYTILVANLSGNIMIGNRFFELSQIPLFYIAYQNNKQLGLDKISRNIIFCLLPFLIVTCLLTIKGCLVDPVVARNVKKTVEGFASMRAGIGGYEFVYFLVIFLCIFLFVLFDKKLNLTLPLKICGKALIVLFVLTIVYSNFMTALLLSSIAIFSRIFYNKINLSKLIIGSLLFLFAFVFIERLILLLIDFAIDFYGKSTNAIRLLELKLIFLGQETGGVAINARSEDFNESINLFLKNPIFGILTKPLTRIGDGVTGFGQHSLIFDTFALFGLGLGILQIFIYTYPFFKRFKYQDGSISSLTITLMIIFLILITINNATPSIGFAALFIFPVTYDWLNSKKTKKYV